MRILIVGNLYPPVVFGGYEILCSQVVKSLEARGHELDVLTSGFGAERCGEEARVTRTLRLTTDFPKPGETVGHVDFSLGALERVARYNKARTLERLEAARYDLVFCWCMNRLSLGPVFAAQERGVPVCYTINDEHPRQYRYTLRVRGVRDAARWAAERWVYPMSTLRNLRPFPMAVLSAATKRRLLAQRLAIAHAEVIHQGIQLEKLAYAPCSRAAGEPLRVLYTGQLSRAKGVHTLLRAAARFQAARGAGSLSLTVVGSGVADYEAELRALVAEGGLGEAAEFLGQVPHETIARLNHEHHVLVFPSEWEEPFGLAHLEAMACGCTVVSTTTGGSAELIRDGENALAFAAGDAEALAGRLARLADDEGLRAGLAAGARDYVEKHHAFEYYVTRLERFLEAAVERNGEGVLGPQAG